MFLWGRGLMMERGQLSECSEWKRWDGGQGSWVRHSLLTTTFKIRERLSGVTISNREDKMHYIHHRQGAPYAIHSSNITLNYGPTNSSHSCLCVFHQRKDKMHQNTSPKLFYFIVKTERPYSIFFKTLLWLSPSHLWPLHPVASP